MFTLKAQDGNARAGTLKTAHGTVKTPFWMPVGTKATVKNLSPEEVEESGARCIIANSLLLSLRPGADLIDSFGGVHKYMRWNNSVFTDSGGFQIGLEQFRLGVNDKGFRYRNPYSGVADRLTPEKAIENQTKIGSDVMMVLDHMPNISPDKKYVQKAVRRTHDWAKRCIEWKKEHGNDKQLMFGIAQGGVFSDIRSESAKFIDSLDFDGVAIGGVAIGETVDQMHQAVDAQLPHFSEEKCRYVMGVGSPFELLEMIERGVDCFDSIFPTQSARRGTLYTSEGKINIRNSKFGRDFSPIDAKSTAKTSQEYSKSYLHHLLKVHEHYGQRLASIQNIHFFQKLLADARAAIIKGEFAAFKKEALAKLS